MRAKRETSTIALRVSPRGHDAHASYERRADLLALLVLAQHALAASWMGVSGFLISCVDRRAAAFQAASWGLDQIGEVFEDEHLAEREPSAA